MPGTISGQLRWFLQHSGETGYRLQRQIGLDSTAISRFLRGRRGLTLTSVDALAKHLKLRLVRDED